MQMNQSQSQDTLMDQLQSLADHARSERFSEQTIQCLLTPRSFSEDSDVLDELSRCVDLANSLGLYDASDYVRHNILKH